MSAPVVDLHGLLRALEPLGWRRRMATVGLCRITPTLAQFIDAHGAGRVGLHGDGIPLGTEMLIPEVPEYLARLESKQEAG